MHFSLRKRLRFHGFLVILWPKYMRIYLFLSIYLPAREGRSLACKNLKSIINYLNFNNLCG